MGAMTKTSKTWARHSILNEPLAFPTIVGKDWGEAWELPVEVGDLVSMRSATATEWYNKHNCYEDEICRKNCLDVCVDYNNRVRLFGEKVEV